jgi:hypothetical protein
MPGYFEFEVSLCGIEPRIWRRFQMLSDLMSFQELHDAIQAAAGWWEYHLWVFRKTPTFDSDPITGISTEDDLEVYGKRLRKPESILLKSYFPKKGTRCYYEYDFGDGWIHEVTLVGEVELPEVFLRRLVAGERAFPHEDCGGTGGYERCVEFLKTGKDPWGDDPDGFREWLDGWDPERFDLDTMKAKFDIVPTAGIRNRILKVLNAKPGKRKPSKKRVKGP